MKLKQTSMMIVYQYAVFYGRNYRAFIIFWVYLMGQCYKDFAVLGKFYAKIITLRL